MNHPQEFKFGQLSHTINYFSLSNSQTFGRDLIASITLTSCDLFTLASLGRKRPHEDKITFTLYYRNLLF